ncbi:GAF domain-containing protein, partial [Fulvivirga sp. RKSG066]|uniref:GAF domain-containing protein n=1 Tax=Fulvivirga aurantia TaxID=2529383 RepID=UPI0012BCB302
MKKWFLGLRLRLKLLLAFGSILLMSVLLTAVGITTIRKVINYNELTEDIENFNISTLKMSRHVQEFADRGFKKEAFLKNQKSQSLEEYQSEYHKLKAVSDKIRTHEFFEKVERKKNYDSLAALLNKYNIDVSALVSLYEERGFKDYGVEGALRSAIHDVEKSSFPYDKTIMLTLRRHEKDFFLRKDLKYLDRFNQSINDFTFQIDTVGGVWIDSQQEMLALVSNYRSKFNHIVDLEQKIGLDTQTGVLGSINTTYAEIEELLNRLTADVKSRNAAIVNQAMILLITLLVFQVVVGFILVVFYANLLTKAIKEIKFALVSLSKGSFPEKLVTRTSDEVAEAKYALNNLVDRIKAAVRFSTDLGKGNLNIEYDSRYDDDVLATAIIKMKDQLVEAENRQSVVNWTNEGMANFSEILKNETESLEVLGDQIIRQMVRYLHANQGALYILDQEQQDLEQIATYAYDKKKYVNGRIKIGQGLVGQCVLERDYIHMTDIPPDFINITSGLGEATASNILIVPLMIRENVMGVIELASFT